MQAHDPGQRKEGLVLMADSFKTTAKPYNGKMQPCKVCDKTPNEGDQMWMQNLGDETNKKWIASPHEECFKKLQENPELGKKEKQFNNRFTSSKFPVGDVPKIFLLAETLLDSFKKKRGIQHDASQSKLTSAEELQAVESFFKSILGGCKP